MGQWVILQDEEPARAKTQQCTSILLGEMSSNLLEPEDGVPGVVVGGEFEKRCLSQFVVKTVCHNIKFKFYSASSDSLMFCCC